MTKVKIRMVMADDGTRLNVRIDNPDGARTILLSHALGGDLSFWDGVTAAFANRFRIVRYDMRGHGASDVPNGPYTVDMIGRDALAVLEAVGVDQADFVGHSMGGMAGMWLAINHPSRVGRLVLANTTPFIAVKDSWDPLIAKALAEGMGPIAEPTISGWLSDVYKAGNPAGTAALVAKMRAMPAAGYAGACAVLRDVDLRDDLGRIAAPTLVVNGADDGPRGDRPAALMTEAIPDALRVDIPASAHLSPAENSAAFVAALESFLP